MAQFTVTRADGRSNQQVVIDLVKGGAAGRLFSYGELAAALQEGTGEEFDTGRVQAAVRAANRRLLREARRYLRVAPRLGYRLIPGDEHLAAAGDRNRRGRRQLKWALDILENVRPDEMTKEQHQRHVAQLVINANVYHQARRLDELERRFARLTHRVEQGGL
jgi:hypothetical protein